MGSLDIVGQKLKGKAQQMKGKLEQASGHPLKGNIDILRGKANEFEAQLKIKAKESR